MGGGSLVYANTLYEPLAPFYDQAKRMLGVNETPEDTPTDGYMKELAERVVDPYFGGEGPDRIGCTHCGGCMVGCRVGAKNTVDRNYLYLAEKNGTIVHPDTQTTDLQALPDEGWLPSLSERLGDVVRTNSEAIVGALGSKVRPELTRGVAITSSIHPDETAHIEPCRYPPKSNAMGLLTTISAVSANLGVNPSLIITAMTERAMSLWPNKGEADLRPAIGSSYVRLDPVVPDHPAVPVGAPAELRFS